ncbi:MAG: type I glyceraldehyde-3-phosphate dehydrogenase [Methanobacteriota archaeon]|nr:MAG: type I glyceraldehyde-3-phosphate dehydrogenase [Euryarchaeota archaeon]
MPKVAINGFGRIGRLVTRALLYHDKRVDIVGINDLADTEMMAHVFEFDSVHGRFEGSVEVHPETHNLVLNGDEFTVYTEPDPKNLPWKELDVDYVVESTGRFRTREGMQKHLDAGAKRVILSAPGKGVDITVVLGVNFDKYDPKRHFLISNASCTTNCLAPLCKVLDDNYGIEHGTMTTVHAYTNDQKLLDMQHKDFRRARAAAMSIVPTTTGAAKAIGDVMPHLKGKLDGMALRVPTPNVSIVDLTVRLKTPAANKEEIEERIIEASKNEMKGILGYEWRSLVSIDFNSNPLSSIVDFPSMMLIDGTLLKILSWYDNEWGYANRIADLIHKMWELEP